MHTLFGSGPVGRSVIHHLLAEGLPVRLATRGPRPAWLDARVSHVRADATDATSTMAACAGATHVYNCTNAADYHRWPEQFPPLQRGVLAGARAAGAVLIAVENLYVYGPHHGAPMTEALALNGRGLRSSTRVEMTRALDEAHRRGDVRVARVRASDLIGPFVTESMAGARLFRPILDGKRSVSLLGDPSLPHAVTAVDDFARTLIATGRDDRAHGLVVHAPSLSPTPAELVAAISREAGRTPPRIVAPPRALAAVLVPLTGLFVPPMRGLAENTYMFYEPFVLDCTRARQLLRLEASPLEDTVRAAVAWYRGTR